MEIISSTTHTLEGYRVVKYIGVVNGLAIMGTNFFRDFLANITDVVGGRAAAYEKSLEEGKDIAMREMFDNAKRKGANAVIGIDLDYESIAMGGEKGSMLMISTSGTAVVIEPLS